MANLEKLLGREAAAISRDALGFREDWTEHGWMVVTGANESVFNVAMMTDQDAGGLRYFGYELKKAEVPFEIWVPEKYMENLAESLEGMGLKERYQLEHMVLNKEGMKKAKEKNSSVRAVESMDRLRETVALQIAVFGFDESIGQTMGQILLADRNIKTWSLYVNEQPAASAMAIIDPAINTAGVWNVVTEKEKQRTGLGTKVMRHLVGELAGLGVEIIHLASTEEGYELYNKLGFRPVGKIVCFG